VVEARLDAKIDLLAESTGKAEARFNDAIKMFEGLIEAQQNELIAARKVGHPQTPAVPA
jgi:hypothetical protein